MLTNSSKRRQTAGAIAQLIPHIIQGAHLGFMAKRAITQTQFLVLISIHSQGQCSMGTIAKNLRVRLPTVTGMVDRLAQSHYLKRVVNPQDRRQVMVTLAPKGQALIKHFQATIAERWQQVLEILTPEEISQFFHIVSKLHAKLRAQR